MGRYLGWLLNALLFAAGCFLVATTANAILASLVAGPPPLPAAPDRSPAEIPERTWDDREGILERNLFNASTLVPPPEPEPEKIEETELPLRLLGTAAHADPDRAWAAVENLDKREALIVGIDDELADDALVVRIERRRIVISEDGTPRELLMDEDDDGRSARQSQRRRVRFAGGRDRSPRERRRLAERVRRLTENRFSVEREDVESVVQNPATLFSEARVLPKYEEGEMVGLQVNAIKPGSVFEEIGMQNGEVITELNGIKIDSPAQSQKILEEFRDHSEFKVLVRGPQGERTLEFSTD